MNYRREDILDLKHLSASSLLIAGVLYFEPDEEGRSDPKYMYKFFGLTKKASFIIRIGLLSKSVYQVSINTGYWSVDGNLCKASNFWTCESQIFTIFKGLHLHELFSKIKVEFRNWSIASSHTVVYETKTPQ